MRELTEAEIVMVSGGGAMSTKTALTIGIVGLFCPIAGLGMTIGYYVNRD